MQIRHQVFAVQNPMDIVQTTLVDGESRVSSAFHDKHDFIKGCTYLDRRHFHPRHHYISDRALGELKYPFKHPRMLVPLGIEKRP